jgi:hypothetical protein
MRSLIKTSENSLLITPVLFTLFASISAVSDAVDIHFHDTYFIIEHHIIPLVFLVVLILPFAMHKLLRRYREKARLILNVHVFVTVVYIAVLYILMYNSELHKPRSYDESPSFL